MARMFRNTLEALESEWHERSWLLWAWPLALLAGWLSWIVWARVPVHASSQAGRLEVQAATHRAAAEATGRVVASSVRLGQEVAQGQVLLELDDMLERLELEQTRAELAGLEARREALEKQLVAEQRVQAWQVSLHGAALERQRISVEAADDQSSYRQRLRAISLELERETLVSQLDAIDSEHALSTSQLQARAARAEMAEREVNHRRDEEVQKARIAAVTRELADLQALAITARAALGTASAALEQRRVRAPIAGKVGSVATLQDGDVVQTGQVIATIVPAERVQAVADFAAADALGRIHPGQSARIVLSGFSLLEFGTLAATVRRVASEPRADLIRVELDLTEQHTRLPVEHGVPMTAQVLVEAVAPWQLLLRTLRPALQGGPAPELEREEADGG